MSGRLLRIQNWEKLAVEAKFEPARMAALCPISLRQMQRFFVQQFAQTPSEWAGVLRGRLALKLVLRGWQNKAIAEELGYADESHFCHAFKRVYGFPPQTYAPMFSGRSHIASRGLAEPIRNNGLMPEMEATYG
jgi:transcriptional regulator GlxA family with amidase domain